MELLNKKGQTTVEYILLLGVMVLLFTAFFKSQRFKDFLGPQGGLFTAYKGVIEHSFQHGSPGAGASIDHSPSHKTYTTGSGSRFFTQREAYPSN